MAPSRRRNSSESNNNNNQNQPQQQPAQPPQDPNPRHGRGPSKPMKCCVPADCIDPAKFIYKEDIQNSRIEVIKVLCNNDHCNEDPWMHRECFETWEQTVLTYLKSCGRARSWSEKQRLQNLWTKRGYDLAFKACGCKCGKGHLRKDLDWIPPARSAPIAIPAQGQPPVDNGKKKKKSKKEQRPALSVSAPVPHPNNNQCNKDKEPQPCTSSSVSRRESTDSAIGSSTPKSGTFDFGSCASSSGIPMSPRPRLNSVSSIASGSSGSSGTGSPPSPGPQFCSATNVVLSGSHRGFQRKNSCGDNRTRRDSGGMFSRRIDFSSFNKLPKHQLNSYHIKMEDEAHGGNDDTRNFILSTLLTARINRVSCILCNSTLQIFDRYPLIDGTFFMSPRQHGTGSLEVLAMDGKAQYLSAVCMGCLEGWNSALICHGCKHRWDGSDLVLGGCYTYDIFAATPCCAERLVCSHCKTLLMLPDQRPTFFSEYSQSSQCPHCGTIDYHLAKRLPDIFEKLTAH